MKSFDSGPQAKGNQGYDSAHKNQKKAAKAMIDLNLGALLTWMHSRHQASNPLAPCLWKNVRHVHVTEG